MPTVNTYSGAVPYQAGLLSGRTSRQMYEEEKLREDSREQARNDLEMEKLQAAREVAELDRTFQTQQAVQDQINFDRQENRRDSEILFKQEENKLKKDIAVQELLLEQQTKDERTAAGLGADPVEIEEAKLNNNLVSLIAKKNQEKIKREGSTKIRTKNKEINKFIDENTLSKAMDRWSPEEIKAARPGYSDLVDEKTWIDNLGSQTRGSVGDETSEETFDRDVKEKSLENRLYEVGEILTLGDNTRVRIIKSGTKKTLDYEVI